MRPGKDLAEALYDLYGPLLSCTQGVHHQKHKNYVLSPEGLTTLPSLMLPPHLEGIPYLPEHFLQGVHQEHKHSCHVKGRPCL